MTAVGFPVDLHSVTAGFTFSTESIAKRLSASIAMGLSLNVPRRHLVSQGAWQMRAQTEARGNFSRTTAAAWSYFPSPINRM